MTLTLSRYACVRAERGRLVAESPHSRAPLELDAATLALLSAFAEARTLVEAAKQARLALDDAARLADRFVEAGVLVSAETGAAERKSVWAFHDRLFHARTRPADRSEWDATRVPPPALLQREWHPVVKLPRPDLDAIERDDAPLARVQAARRSVRVHGVRPLETAALSEFFFRVARVDDVWSAGGVTHATRPYPSAGALYELEPYVVLRDCAGVEPGLYHYSGDHHRLERVAAFDERVEQLLADAAAGMGVTPLPQALVVLSARFPRIATKYGPLAYSLVLKDVGVLLGTMYLTATAMGLAGCAVGAGSAALFAEVTGLPVEEETSVGEFCLGMPVEAPEKTSAVGRPAGASHTPPGG